MSRVFSSRKGNILLFMTYVIQPPISQI